VKEILYVERIAQAEALFKPQRVEVLRLLAEPRTCTEVAARLGQSTQRVYYHVRKLVEAGLAVQVSARRVRGIDEGIYRAAARSYWLSPGLIGTIGPRRTRDQLSAGYLLELLEDVQSDLAEVLGPLLPEGDPIDSQTGEADEGEPAPTTLGVSGEIRVPAEARDAFLADLKITLQQLFARHGGAAGETYRMAAVLYPKPTKGHDHE
jgi:DNA-binding transcriptional ArsR family regulator